MNFQHFWPRSLRMQQPVFNLPPCFPLFCNLFLSRLISLVFVHVDQPVELLRNFLATVFIYILHINTNHRNDLFLILIFEAFLIVKYLWVFFDTFLQQILWEILNKLIYSVGLMGINSSCCYSEVDFFHLQFNPSAVN